jgi:large subunit ribosomal protein L15
VKLFELTPNAGARKKRFRVGRGEGSGNGKTSGRGQDGQNSRSGGGVRPGFEGGRMPLYRLLPKRGFNNKRFAKVYAEVSLSSLNVFEDGAVVDEDMIIEKGIVKKLHTGIKILGNGPINKKLTVKVSKITKGAKNQLEAAGGKAEVI